MHTFNVTTPTYHYFAYGSNMLTRRLRARDRAPSAHVIGIGHVEGRRLTFNKLGRDGSGKCDLEASSDTADLVHGVVFRLASSERAALDKIEGLGKGYDEQSIRVVTAGGVLNASTYVATRKAPALRPFHWYKAFVVAGALEHGLPGAYVEWLKTFESQADPHVGRRKVNEAILTGAKNDDSHNS